MTAQNEFDEHSTAITRTVSNITGGLGSFPAILLSIGLVIAWLVGGLFVTGGFSNATYQLVITAGTTAVTFLMVFIIQNTQNRDDRAVQAKLDAQSEVLRVMAEKLGIDDDQDLLTRLVGVEDAPQDEIKDKQQRVRETASGSGGKG
jgi:low affinity Fe/Cu permease